MSTAMESDPAAQGSRMMRRMKIFLIVAIAAAVLSTSALVVSLFVKSPQQRAAEKQPPPPSIITTAVQSKILRKDVIVRGKLDFQASTEIRVPGTKSDTLPIVTALMAKNGDAINAGTAVVAVSGRPVFVLHGAIPQYRDLLPGMEGNDVTQLQKALVELELLPASGETGVFDANTGNAIKQLYKKNDFAPLTTADLDPSEAEKISAARKRVAAAQREPSVEKSAEPKTPKQPAPSELAEANRDLNALLAKSGTVLPMREVAMSAQLPAVATQINVQVGSQCKPEEPIMVLGTGALAALGTVPQGSRDGINVDQKARIVVEQLDEKPASVTMIKDLQQGAVGKPGTKPADGPPGYPIVVSTSEALPTTLFGKDVRILVAVQTTDKPVLVVPVAAVRTGPDGKSFVRIENNNQRKEIPVRVGLIANGEAEVSSDDSAFAAGTKVVVN